MHFDLRRTKLQLGRTPIHSGRTNNKPQFHLGRTECPVVSSLRRIISQTGRTMSVTNGYFKAWFTVHLVPKLSGILYFCVTISLVVLKMAAVKYFRRNSMKFNESWCS